MKNERLFIISGLRALSTNQGSACEILLREHEGVITLDSDIHPTRLTPAQARFLAGELDALADRIDKTQRRKAKETPSPATKKIVRKGRPPKTAPKEEPVT